MPAAWCASGPASLLLARLNRRTNQRAQPAKTDPRQLAFPIEDHKKSALIWKLPLRQRYWRLGRKPKGKGAAYEKGD